jgi:Zn-dependent alcohol dehydrogenase
VRTLGHEVSGLAPGDVVMGFASDAFASHVTLPAAQLFRAPAGLSPEAAATIPVAFVTAWYALAETARLRTGETVLIHGAAGGVQTLHDGPFAETREHLGGYYEIDVPDLDAALYWAKRIPVTPGGKIEVRPHADYGG